MNFAKVAAALVTDHTDFRQLAKEAQAALAEYDDDPDEERRNSRSRALLWTLGGLGALGAGAYGLHRLGALDAVGDVFRPAGGAGEVGPTQQAMEWMGNLPSAGPSVAGIPAGSYGLGALGGLAAAATTPAVRRNFPGSRRALKALSPNVSPYGARGMARYLRNAPGTTTHVKELPRHNWLDLLDITGSRSVAETRAAADRAFEALPAGVQRERLAEAMETLLDDPSDINNRTAAQRMLAAHLSMNPNVSNQASFQQQPISRQLTQNLPWHSRIGRMLSAQSRDIAGLEEFGNAIEGLSFDAVQRNSPAAQRRLIDVAEELGVDTRAPATAALQRELQSEVQQALTDAQANASHRLGAQDRARIEADVTNRFDLPSRLPRAQAALAAEALAGVRDSSRQFARVRHPYATTPAAIRRGALGALAVPVIGTVGSTAAEWLAD